MFFKRNFLKLKFEKKSQFPMVKTILILLISVFILVSFIFILVENKNISIDDKKLKTQVLINNILANCFSNNLDKVGVIDLDLFNENKLKSCVGDDIYIYLKLNKFKKIIYNDQNGFNSKVDLCKYKSTNLLCTKMEYPILVKEDSLTRDFIIDVLTVVIIAQ